MKKNEALFEYVLRLADDALINGQRLSEWCGHGPFLEEDVGVANTALDLIGRARLLLTYAGQLEGKGRDEDALAYGRDEREFRNVLMLELPNGDFAFTCVRQYLVDAYNSLLYGHLLESRDETLAGIAGRAAKESAYHLRHTREWMLRLGDGTEESHMRSQQALDRLWPYAAEFFTADAVTGVIGELGVGPDPQRLRHEWYSETRETFRRATLEPGDEGFHPSGGRDGRHTEYMGFLLAEMQFLQRAYPGLTW